MELFDAMQSQIAQNAGVNAFELVRMGGALSKQIYLPVVLDFEDDEALVLATDLPRTRRDWNFQLNDLDAVEYVYGLSITNGHFSNVSSDGAASQSDKPRRGLRFCFARLGFVTNRRDQLLRLMRSAKPGHDLDQAPPQGPVRVANRKATSRVIETAGDRRRRLPEERTERIGRAQEQRLCRCAVEKADRIRNLEQDGQAVSDRVVSRLGPSLRQGRTWRADPSLEGTSTTYWCTSAQTRTPPAKHLGPSGYADITIGCRRYRTSVDSEPANTSE